MGRRVLHSGALSTPSRILGPLMLLAVGFVGSNSAASVELRVTPDGQTAFLLLGKLPNPTVN
jgi:hypothetical protein